MSGTREKKKLSLTTWIALGLVLGVIAGLAFQGAPDVATEYIKPFGTIYLNLIKMVVVPVVLLSIMQGIVSLQDVRKVGSIGVKTICFYLITTAIASGPRTPPGWAGGTGPPPPSGPRPGGTVHRWTAPFGPGRGPEPGR